MSPSLLTIANPQQTNSILSSTTMALPRAMMMVDPRCFDVVEAINPHMKNQDGSLNKVDKSLARSQWEKLMATYLELGYPVHVCPGVPGLADMVFCANQSLPFLDPHGKKMAYMSTMASPSRQPEVPHIESFLKKLGVETITGWNNGLNQPFEGTGDALWVPGRRFLLGGYGFRSGSDVYKPLVQSMGIDIALFELRNPKFYHLDTCLSILREDAALACKDAFTESGWALLQSLFPGLIEVPLTEADSPGFACNAHCPDGRHVILQKGSVKTERILKESGFTPLPLETGEFIKSGGSVFCMKLAMW